MMPKKRAEDVEHDHDDDGVIEEGARSFTRALEQIDDGHGVIEMSVELQTLLKNLSEHASLTRGDAKGTYTLKLAFSVEPNGITNIGYQVDTKTPKRKTGKTTLWLTRGGNLSVSNPRQQTLPLRDVAGARSFVDMPVANDRTPKDV